MAYVCVEPCEEALNKFNEFKKTKNITTIMLNIRKIEGIDHVVFVKNFFQDSTEEDIINSLPDYEPIFIYRKININNKEEKIISIVFFPKNAKAKHKMLYGVIHKELNSKLKDIFETILTEEPSDIYKGNLLKKFIKLN